MKIILTLLCASLMLFGEEEKNTIDVVTAKATIARLEASVSTNTEKINQLKNVINEKKSFIEKNNANLDKGRELTKKVKEQIDFLQKNLDICLDIATANKLEDQIKDLIFKMRAMEKKMASERINVARSRDIIADSEKEIAFLTNQNDAMNKYIENLKKMIEYTETYRGEMDTKMGGGATLLNDVDAYLKQE